MRTLSFLCLLMICLLCSGVNALAQTQKPPNLAEIAASIKQRDGKIQSLQIWGTLKRETSAEAVEKIHRAIGKNAPSGVTAQDTSSGEEFYAASIGEKGVTSSRANTGVISGQKLTPEMQQNLREQLLAANAQVFDGKFNYSVPSGGAKKTVLMRSGERDGLLGDTYAGFRSGSNTVPLDKLLVQQGYEFIGYEADARFGRLIRLKGTTTQGDANEIWLAAERDYLVVKEETVRRSLSRFEVTAMEQIKGLWIPKAYSYSVEPMFRSTTVRSAISLNDVPESVCTVTLNVGDTVNDIDTGAWWTVGQNGERLYQKATGNHAGTQGLPSWFYTANIATLLILTVLAYIRWKRKQWANAV